MLNQPTGHTFSVIIPTFQRPLQLARCLQSLVRSTYPREQFEVVVVDDGSDQPPQAVIAAFRQYINITLLTQSHAGPAQARNTAAAQARGKFFAFTDDDCVPDPNWLSNLEQYLAEAPSNAVGGQIINALDSNPYSTASQRIIDYVYAYYNTDPARARFFSSNNFALPAKLFHLIGGFDPTFRTAEDRDLCDRWLCHGYAMTFASDAMVYHLHPLTFRGYGKQHFEYGRGAVHFLLSSRRRHGGRWKLEFRFYLGLCNPRYYSRQQHSRLKYAALVVIWQALNLAGFLWEAWKQHRARRESHHTSVRVDRVF